ncbi:hypothetical protein FOL47_000231 [Perkinsus chesapeaki]|uniref:OTU domain-containing protein n=1 Tax=Perkinsus chesapeaki TaxID=330153 RepID=A0A7J6MM54_PERCH|nr:hypothetical protein FOL47_000231 [Perkinsus chesapeaki]
MARGSKKKGAPKHQRHDRSSPPEDLNQVRRMLQKRGLLIQEALPDGNCLFRSFALQLKGVETFHDEYRQACCDWLESHEDVFGDFVDLSEEGFEHYSDYVGNMRRSGTWGGQVELTALCGAYDVAALVIRAEGVHYEIKAKEVDPEVTQCIILSYHDGEHYNSVVWADREDRTLAEVREKFCSTEVSEVDAPKLSKKELKKQQKEKRKNKGKAGRKKAASVSDTEEPPHLVQVVLARNIKPAEFIMKLGAGGAIDGGFKIPNLRRAPFWKFIWTQQFVAREHFFSVHHAGLLFSMAFFWWTGWFDTAPVERRDKYYMNGAKFRLQSAYHNPGSRPAYKIAQEQAKIRYFYRGFDHPYTINEAKDQLWKLRENWVIQNYPGVQYPYVSKQMMPSQLPDKMTFFCEANERLLRHCAMKLLVSQARIAIHMLSTRVLYSGSTLLTRFGPAMARPALIRLSTAMAAPTFRVPAGRGFSTTATADEAHQEESHAGGEGEQTHQEYSKSKELGNPITWANPTGGPTIDDYSSDNWKWVFPVGTGLIFFFGWIKGRKDRKEKSLIRGSPAAY